MIKASSRTSEGYPVLLLGLSGENVTRLAAGEPISIPAKDIALLGLPQVGVVICYGRTEQHIIDELEANGISIGSGTSS